MKKVVIILIFIFFLSLAGCGKPTVTEVKIVPDSISIAPGECLQLSVEGYTKNGRQAGEDQMKKLNLCWEYRTNDNAFTVDEDGCLTGLSAGGGNVWVKSEDGKLNSRAITVSVKSNRE